MMWLIHNIRISWEDGPLQDIITGCLFLIIFGAALYLTGGDF